MNPQEADKARILGLSIPESLGECGLGKGKEEKGLPRLDPGLLFFLVILCPFELAWITLEFQSVLSTLT